MKKIMFATSNRDKLREVMELLPSDIDLVTPADLNVVMPEEIGNSFDQNALIKSKVIFSKYSFPTIAEDSGLVVDALDGKPGIYSARYADDPVSAYKKILQEMEGKENRSARFMCTVSFSWKGGDEKFRGIIEGNISQSPQGEGGFGYDPIFLFDGRRTTAEITHEEKNKISHRGKAIRKFVNWFKENYNLIFPAE